jgi:hypothetical protein
MSEKVISTILETETELVTSVIREGTITNIIIQSFMTVEIPTGALVAGTEAEIDTLVYTGNVTYNKMLAIIVDSENGQQFPTTFKMKTAGDTSIILVEIPFNSTGLFINAVFFNQS